VSDAKIVAAARRVVEIELRVFAPATIDQPSPPTPTYAELIEARAALRAAVLGEPATSVETGWLPWHDPTSEAAE